MESEEKIGFDVKNEYFFFNFSITRVQLTE